MSSGRTGFEEHRTNTVKSSRQSADEDLIAYTDVFAPDSACWEQPDRPELAMRTGSSSAVAPRHQQPQR